MHSLPPDLLHYWSSFSVWQPWQQYKGCQSAFNASEPVGRSQASARSTSQACSWWPPSAEVSWKGGLLSRRWWVWCQGDCLPGTTPRTPVQPVHACCLLRCENRESLLSEDSYIGNPKESADFLHDCCRACKHSVVILCPLACYYLSLRPVVGYLCK